MTIVVDASVTLDWLLESERSSYAAGVFGYIVRDGGVAPSIWPSEVTNGFLKALRRNRANIEEIERSFIVLASTNVRIDTFTDMEAMRTWFRLGNEYDLTSYDASYVDLALRERVPLATNDEKMRAAAKKLGIKIFKP